MTPLRLAVLVLLLCGHVAASAQEFTAYAAAKAQFDQMVQASAKQNRMPQLGNPAEAKVLATLSDSKRFIDTVKFELKDLGGVLSMCGQANGAMIEYLKFRMGSFDIHAIQGKVTAPLSDQLAMERNIKTYQDEVTPVISFSLRCMGDQVVLLAEFSGKLTPAEMNATRIAALAQVRGGVLQTFVGAANISTERDLKMVNRKMLIDTLAGVATRYAAVLELVQRKQVRDLFASILPGAELELAPQLQRIVEAMDSSECVGLCRLGTATAAAP